jgi:ataxia telangiectasia mutated family protein
MDRARTQASSTLAQQRQAFDDVCARFPPVFHAFFLEAFRDPGVWYERRLSYARSLAASSMAGFVIGLGDRHLSNILIDTSTAEVVHIDLGIAFEQGKFLSTPELVPFRLTRDLVDGLGVTGVEGVMRRCCEETLRVVRAHKEMLLTVVEVFIHDPLYRWALTAAEANRKQALQDGEVRGDEEELVVGSAPLGNADAERTLLRMRQKLEGMEAGSGEVLGVEGQVQLLLQEAMDRGLLSRMYVGWQAWC